MIKLCRLNELRLSVVRDVENRYACADDVLPAIFFENVLDLGEVDQLKLEILINMYLLGRGINSP